MLSLVKTYIYSVFVFITQGIVGPLTFRTIESETYTSALESDPNPLYELNSSASSVFNDDYKLSTDTDEGYDSLCQPLHQDQDQRIEDNRSIGQPQQSSDYIKTLQYLDLYLTSEYDEEAIGQRIMSNIDLYVKQSLSSSVINLTSEYDEAATGERVMSNIGLYVKHSLSSRETNFRELFPSE